MAPTVSIICTAKDAEATIDDTLTSVRSQSFRDWELIVVDDGSGDGTIDRILHHSREDPRIRLISTEGIGRAKALNLALSETRGHLIANIDADDLVHPDQLRILLESALRKPPFAVLCTDYVIIGAGETPEWTVAVKELILPLRDITRDLMKRNPVCHSSVIMHKDALLSVGGYDESLSTQIDYDLWIRLAHRGNKIGKISTVLAAKRIHRGQSFEARNRLRYLINSARTQARAIRLLGGRWHHWLSLILRFIWGLRPRRLVGSIFKRRTSSGS